MESFSFANIFIFCQYIYIAPGYKASYSLCLFKCSLKRQIAKQQDVFENINKLIEVVVSKSSQFDQLDIRLKSLELSLMGQQNKLRQIGN